MSKAIVTKKLGIYDMKIENLIYIIGYSAGAEIGYIGYDNNPCNSVDHAMKFSSRIEAETNLTALKSEWKSDLFIIDVSRE